MARIAQYGTASVGRQAPNGYGLFAGGASTGSFYADFDQSYNPISGYDAQTAASNYSVRSGDTLTSIALALWGDASLSYLIAQANGMDATSLGLKTKGPAKLPKRRCTGPGTTLKGEKSGPFAASGG
jgi:hypothetical protein